MSHQPVSAGDRPVSEIMQREFVSLALKDCLDLADDVMRLGRIRHMPVLDGKRLAGIVTQRDLLSASLSKALSFDSEERRTFLRSVQIAEVMTRNVLSVTPDTPLREVARLMIRHKIGCIPVVAEGDEPLGLVTEVDLLRAFYGVSESSDPDGSSDPPGSSGSSE